MEPDTLQLSRAVQIACQIEMAKPEAQQITGATAKPQSMDSIQKVSKGFRPAPKSDSKEEAPFFHRILGWAPFSAPIVDGEIINPAVRIVQQLVKFVDSVRRSVYG